MEPLFDAVLIARLERENRELKARVEALEAWLLAAELERSRRPAGEDSGVHEPARRRLRLV